MKRTNHALNPARFLALALVVVPPVGARAVSADPYMGDWHAADRDGQQDDHPLVAQIIALGKSTYRAILREAFDTRSEPVAVLDGRAEAGNLTLSSSNGVWQASVTNGVFHGAGRRGASDLTFTLRPVQRRSPTLGQSAPDGAVVLFDGSGLGAWLTMHGKEATEATWTLRKGEAVEVRPGEGSLISKQSFGDCTLHLEFRTPFTPEARGQKRGNSGVYLQGRYEIQVLDSYGLEGEHNECGGIYKLSAPRVNMCAPPGQWQTYDIEFTAPRLDEAGVKTANARITVRHNGVLIHEDLELPGPTGSAGAMPEVAAAPLRLQDHGNLVQYRNIWVIEKGE